MYRSISNPSELREVLKNMLIEEIMKDDFSVQNDIITIAISHITCRLYHLTLNIAISSLSRDRIIWI
jgi:hypothetical protein